MVNTPGFGGYLVAWAVSVLSLALLCGGTGFLISGDAEIFAGIVILVAFYGAIASVPFACVGMPLVHLACRRAEAQWVHVVAAGAVGFATTVLLGGVSRHSIAAAFLLPVATMVGRASVVPLVERRRRRAANAVGVAADVLVG